MTPFSQNSKRWGSFGLAQAQLTHMKPSGLFWRSNCFVASDVGTWRSPPKRNSDFTEPQPPAGESYGSNFSWRVMDRILATDPMGNAIARKGG